jgi:hypothetical protein
MLEQFCLSTSVVRRYKVCTPDRAILEIKREWEESQRGEFNETCLNF